NACHAERHPSPSDRTTRGRPSANRRSLCPGKPDFLYERPIAERHRIVFYIGHLEAFDWNLFHERALGLKNFHPEFDRLFAFGIDPVGGGLPTDQPSDWPTTAAVREYVRKIR